MKPLSATFDPSPPQESPAATLMRPFALGMVVNFLTVAVGNPYQLAVLGLLAAFAAAFIWTGRPLSWMIFAAVSAANPANFGTPVAINLLCAVVFFILKRDGGWKVLPRLSQFALLFALLSVVVSVIASLASTPEVPTIRLADINDTRPMGTTWTGGASMDIVGSQLAAIINYVLGPFLLIPLIFSRIREHHSSEQLVKGLVYGLLVPTLSLFMITRILGTPILDSQALANGLVNVSAFRLGKVDVQMLRTQVGIILAALICASFAITIAQVRKETRLVAAGCLITSIYFLLITGSVGSSLSAMAGIGVMLLMSLRHYSFKRYMVLLLVGVGLTVATTAVLPQSVQGYVTTRYQLRVGKHSSSTADRSWRWKKSYDYLMENPSGVGWSIYVEPIRIYPHNDYLTYGIAFGVICGLIYLFYPIGLIWSFFSITVFRRGSMDPSALALALTGAGVTTAMLINSMSDHMTANRWYFNVVWCLIWYSFFASRAANAPSGSKTP